MRRVCLFLLLVIGWSILLMTQDRNGRNDILPAHQALAMTLECVPTTEDECFAGGGSWDSAACCCEFPDPECDPVEEIICELDPLCNWDDVLCQCNCQVCGPPQEHFVMSITIGPYPACVDGVEKMCTKRIDYYETVNCFGEVISTREAPNPEICN